MRFHNFWCISFVFSEFLKHVQKTPKSWEKVCSITIFHQNPEKHSCRPEKPSKLPFFLPTSFPDMSESRFCTCLLLLIQLIILFSLLDYLPVLAFVTRHWTGFVHIYLIALSMSESKMSLLMCMPYLMVYLRVPCWAPCCILCTLPP